MVWLKENIYSGKNTKIKIEVKSAMERFSNRQGNIKDVNI